MMSTTRDEAGSHGPSAEPGHKFAIREYWVSRKSPTNRAAIVRFYPAKPKVGVQATQPNELWHIDASIPRLLDSTKVYMDVVIDNYSRKILDWLVTGSMDPLSTCKIMQQAAEHLGDSSALGVVCDSGIENLNREVDDFLSKFCWKRIKALVDVTYSNSKTERWWQSLKHQWLFLNQLNTIEE